MAKTIRTDVSDNAPYRPTGTRAVERRQARAFTRNAMQRVPQMGYADTVAAVWSANRFI